jgi:pentatricopeptide repeat protein
MRLREQGFELGIDGANACMAAFMRTSRLETVSTIYRVLRHHVVPEVADNELDDEHDIHAAVRYLDVVEGIAIAEDVIPDRISYTIMIQSLAYQGELIPALQVFADMLSSPDIEPFAPHFRNEDGDMQPAYYPTTLPVFRALFLGFARHAQQPEIRGKERASIRLANGDSLKYHNSPWTLSNLDLLFKSFLELPPGTRPSERMIYWLLVAFAKASRNNHNKMQKVWALLRGRFKEGQWKGRLERFRQRAYGEIPDDEEWKEGR